jgi:hypothetical protein
MSRLRAYFVSGIRSGPEAQAATRQKTGACHFETLRHTLWFACGPSQRSTPSPMDSAGLACSRAAGSCTTRARILCQEKWARLSRIDHPPAPSRTGCRNRTAVCRSRFRMDMAGPEPCRGSDCRRLTEIINPQPKRSLHEPSVPKYREPCQLAWATRLANVTRPSVV